MGRAEAYKQELAKLKGLFKEVEPSKAKLVEGLVEDAAYLRAENAMLKRHMLETGMVKIHPEKPEIQKPVETAIQYLKNVNSYAVIIKALNSILGKDLKEKEDEFDQFLKDVRGGG